MKVGEFLPYTVFFPTNPQFLSLSSKPFLANTVILTEVNDLIYLKIRPFLMKLRARRTNEKLAPKFFGPY